MMRNNSLIFTCLVLSSFFIYINADLNLQENHIDETRNSQRKSNAYRFAEDVSPPQRANCDCENGECVTENGKDVCKCAPGYGNYTRSYCKACKCGPNKGCIFIKRSFWNTEQVCICNPGYIEDNGNCVATPCSSNPCKNGGNCTNSGKQFTCNCVKPYTGKTCQTSPCTSKPCKNGGKCNVDGKGFNCSCTVPWKGKTCEEGPCTSNPCKNGGKCNVEGKGFNCSCIEPWKGKICEEGPCASNPCQNNGECKVENENFKCKCKEPYKGNLCQIGPCSSNPCQDRGKCKVVGTNFQCDCTLPYKGNRCENDPCTTNPCLNKGNCTVKGNSFKCTCKGPFLGDRCEKDVCSSNPCHNGGKCKIKGNTYSCDCNEEYVGNRCQHECDCKNGKCRVASDDDVLCECLPEYGKRSKHCEACECGTGANCTWESGFWGLTETKYCLCPNGSRLEEKKCEDPCTYNPCKNGGTCSLFKESFKCHCKEQFGGDTCQHELFATTTETTFPSTKTTVSSFSTTKTISTTSPLRSTTHNFTDTTTSNFTDGINMTTSEPSNFTYDFNRTTSEPSNFTQDFNRTTYQPSNFTNDFNWTTHDPSNFTVYFNQTTYEPSNFTQDFNRSTFQPSNFTNDFNWTTHEPSNFTVDFNETTNEPSNFTSDINITSYTTYEPANSTYDFNLTTYEPSNFTDYVNMTTYEPSNITNENNTSESTKLVFTTRIPITTMTTKKPSICDYNPCQNGGTCWDDKGIAKCICSSQYTGDNCTDTLWCTEGEGKDLCQGGGCTFDFQTKLGRCTCPENKYYNYERKQCEVLDLCPFMDRKCNEANNEVCKNGDCQCKEDFIRNNASKCVPNFCALNPCGENEDCEDIENDPGYVKCKCKKGYIFNGEYCMEGNVCSVPSKLKCQQICNIDIGSCDCFSGFILQSDKKTCVRENSTELCSMDCGVGTCMNVNGNDSCLCPPTHVFNGVTCIDLCTANQIPEGLCPRNACVVDKGLVYKCKCDGKFTYDETGFTCRKKLMCIEGGGKEACKKKNSICMEDFEHPDGFTCKCEKGLAEDIDGTCKRKCDLSSQKEECSRKGAVCDMDGIHAICRCPPLLTFGPGGRCSDFVKASYSGEITLSLERYSSLKLFYPASQAETPDASINIDLIRQDLRESMHILYGEKYRFANILNCRVENNKLKCLVELQFQSDPQDQVKLIQDSQSCLNVDKNTCFIPPKLLIDKESQKTATFVETDPCSKFISKDYCGRDTECKRKKGLSFECACSEGLESYRSYQPISDPNTFIHQCQDIDECKQKTACPNTTSCFNIYRSYKCLCLKGFKPPTENSDLKHSGCVDLCNPNPCKHGKCEIVGDIYGCKCDAGYTGFDCNEVILNTAGKEGMKVALIVLSVLVVPLILLSVFMFYQYRTLKKRAFKSNYYDDLSSTIDLQPMRIETDE